MALEHDNSMMENLYWWGVPTLFRCPQAKVLGSDISLVAFRIQQEMGQRKEINTLALEL